MKSGGGGIKVPGGGGGAVEGGGGTNISPSTRSGTDITDPLDNRSPPTGGKKKSQRKVQCCCKKSRYIKKER